MIFTDRSELCADIILKNIQERIIDGMGELLLEQARNLLLERVERIEETEIVSLLDAPGRVLAEDIFAGHDQPPFPRSPLDGYAVKSEDIKEASKEHPVRLTVIDEVDAGYVSEKYVDRKTAVRIMTGAPVPEGADCIVGQEDTDYGEEIVEIYETIGEYENYCFAGEDYKTGAKLLNKDTFLGAVEIGILASLGIEKVTVYRKVRLAVLTTGDETILPGEELSGGKIYDSNLYMTAARLKMWEMDVTQRGHVRDEAKAAAEKIRTFAEYADIIITTGGVSVGKKDIMHEVLKILHCERIFWKIAVKPGMPTLCAVYQGKLLICLSGNPYGVAVNLELLVRPVLAKAAGRNDLRLKRLQAVSESCFPKKSMVTRYVRAHYESGRVRIPDGSGASGILASMCGCNCLIELPAGTPELKEGERVWIILL